MRLLSAADWQLIHERSRHPAFAAAVARLRSEGADFLARPVAVPAEPGGYYHDYFCPDHGVQLHFDPATPTVHRCPVDDVQWHGARFDAAWRWFVNNRLAESAIRLALLWRLEGDPAQLAPVIRTLTGYAERYAAYQQAPHTVANPGVATYTTLDESVWVLPLAWAFALVRDQLTPAQVTQISTDLLEPVADHLIRHHFGGVHNFACWHNAAIGTIGVVLARADLIDFALHSEFGCERQLADGVLADGLWFEGSFSYHFYTVYALLILAKALRQLPEHDLRSHPQLRAMLLAPIHSAYPDGSLPATNDCWYFTSVLSECCHGVPPAPAFYELGYAWYDEPAFGQLLRQAYEQTPRDTLDALLFGRTLLPDELSPALPSTLLTASGYAILRTPSTAASAADQRYLLLKYGPHGGGHGHPDKLNLLLFAYGQRFSADLGTPGYGIDLFESWYRQTVCHNTVLIEGCSQPEATGELGHFQTDGAFQVAEASVRWGDHAGVYSGVTLHRLVLARPTYFLDLFWVAAPQLRRIDWIYHNAGALHTALALPSYPALADEGDGYPHIAQPQGAAVPGAFVADWRLTGVGLQLFAAANEQNSVFTGLTPGNPPGEQRSALLQRRSGTTALFCSLFHPYQGDPLISQVEWQTENKPGAGWVGCAVTVAGRREQWVVQNQTLATPPSWFTTAPADERFTYTAHF